MNVIMNCPRKSFWTVNSFVAYGNFGFLKGFCGPRISCKDPKRETCKPCAKDVLDGSRHECFLIGGNCSSSSSSVSSPHLHSTCCFQAACKLLMGLPAKVCAPDAADAKVAGAVLENGCSDAATMSSRLHYPTNNSRSWP